MHDTVDDVINFCNCHIEYLTAVNKFNTIRLLSKKGLL